MPIIGAPKSMASTTLVSKDVSMLLRTASTGLFVVFLGSVVVEMVPLEPLNTGWQLRFCSVLISSGVIALLGFCLIHLAYTANPKNIYINQRLEVVRTWAIAASIGFLLLIPLQGAATFQFFSQAKQAESAQREAAMKRLAPIENAVSSAKSVEDLQARLKTINMQARVDPADLTKPLPALRSKLLADIETQKIRISDRFSGPQPSDIWKAIQTCTRVLILSIGYSFAFAGGAQASGSSNTLLEKLFNRLAR